MLPTFRSAAARILARLAAPPDTKSHRAAPFITIDGPRAPVWAPRDATAFAREGYMQNAIAYRAVRLIAEAAGSIPLLVYEGDGEVEAHHLRDLLRTPHPGATTAELIEHTLGSLLVTGNAFLEVLADAAGHLRELHVLRADRVRIVPGPDGWPDAHDYTLDGRVTRIAGEAAPGVPRVLHLKLWHPLEDHYGFSPIEAAASAIDLHNAASAWNKALLDNSARPSGALVYAARDGSALTSDQYDRLKRELESGFQGAGNAGRPLLLEGGLDWKAMSLSPKDLDFQEARNAAAREIALAIGVPPQLLGIPGDATYSNYQEANRALWRHTILPLIHRFAAALTQWLGASAAVTIRPDLDAVEALAPDRDALWKRLDRTTFLTINEKRALAGYGPLASDPALKFDPAQPRNPSGSGRQSGRWTRNPGGSAGGGSSDAGTESADPEDGGATPPLERIDDVDPAPRPWETEVWPSLEPDAAPPDGDRVRPTGDEFEPRERDPNLIDVSQRVTMLPGTPAQQARFSVAYSEARIQSNLARTIDPTWREPTSAYSTIEGQIRHYEGVA
jgi:HK97 family phage portal protein